MTILVAIGANLSGPGYSSPLQTCRAAVAQLGQIAGVRLTGLSRWYETEPVPPSGQAPYINAVVTLRPVSGRSIDPSRLLGQLMAIERGLGRTRGAQNAARTLDLDLIGIDSLIREAPDPILPHPRAHLRAFVLAPLADVAPDWVHPIYRETAGALLRRLPPQGIRIHNAT